MYQFFRISCLIEVSMRRRVTFRADYVFFKAERKTAVHLMMMHASRDAILLVTQMHCDNRATGCDIAVSLVQQRQWALTKIKPEYFK